MILSKGQILGEESVRLRHLSSPALWTVRPNHWNYLLRALLPVLKIMSTSITTRSQSAFCSLILNFKKIKARNLVLTLKRIKMIGWIYHVIQTNMTEMFTLIMWRTDKQRGIESSIVLLKINEISMFFRPDLSYSKNLFASVNCIFSPDWVVYCYIALKSGNWHKSPYHI